MKLRIRGNSLRLRLGRSEVQRLVGDGVVREATPFGPGQHLTYELRASADADEPRASFDGGGIRVVLPLSRARRWADSGEIGISAEQSAGAGKILRLLIEKDFECLTAPPAEDQADAFPQPGAAACGPEGAGA